MLINRGIRRFRQLNSLEHVIQGLSGLVRLKKHPAQAVEIRGVLGFEFQRFFNHLASSGQVQAVLGPDRKSTRLNSSHVKISYAVFCLKKKKKYDVFYCY